MTHVHHHPLMGKCPKQLDWVQFLIFLFKVAPIMHMSAKPQASGNKMKV